jgi:hypothetical protein
MGIWATWKRRMGQAGGQRWTFFLAVITTYVIIWLVSFRITLFDDQRSKYLIFLLPAYYLLVAKGWDCFSNPVLKTTLISLAVLICLVSIYPFYFEWDQVGKGNFRAAATYVRLKLEENDVIYHSNGASTLPFEYYFDWRVPQNRIGAKDIDPNSIGNGGIWLILLQQKSGFEVGLASFQGRHAEVQGEQNNLASLCARYVRDNSLRLVDFQTFPGRNRMIICLYRRGDA